MNDNEKFKRGCAIEELMQAQDVNLHALTRDWLTSATRYNYSRHFEWLGRPIIQFPQDIVGLQQLLWEVKPDLVVETGIARGGSLIFYASILELIAQCGGPANSKVVGIDIEIRAHNREAILSHPMSKRIEMIEGSSISLEVIETVFRLSAGYQRVMVCLDSNHTHDHVLAELNAYAPLTSVGSFCVVLDTIVQDMPADMYPERAWGLHDNPKTAVLEYLKFHPEFVIDRTLQNRLLITASPDGFLRRLA